jgi:cell pole-organizing protein PopZ
MGDIQQDPSMEEILASIKRVISEDGRAPAQARPSRRARGESVAPPPAAEEDVLELDDPVDQDNGLISDNVAAVSRQSLAALSAVRSAPPAADGGALDAVVRDMLRPILKDWLDQNLPQIVEDLVTREIARITGRKF